MGEQQLAYANARTRRLPIAILTLSKSLVCCYREIQMEPSTKGIGAIRIAATLIGVVCASTAGAADEPADTQRDLSGPRIQAASCAAVVWKKDLLEQYPRIGERCQEVVISDGRKWARFEADYLRSDRDRSVTLNFKDRHGRALEEITLLPPATQRAWIDGRPYRFDDLSFGQVLNVYIPEGIFAVATEAGAPPDQLAEIVVRAMRRPALSE